MSKLTPETLAIAKSFRDELEKQVPVFLRRVVGYLEQEYQLDVKDLPADHVCWRTSSVPEYTSLVSSLKKDSENFRLLIESEIGGRPIATFQTLWEPKLSSASHSVNVVEIPSPKDGSPYATGLEHVEFVIRNEQQCTTPWNNAHHQNVLNDFVDKHATLPWNRKAQGKDINPDVSLKFQLDDFGKCSVKFHLMPLAKVIVAEKEATASSYGSN